MKQFLVVLHASEPNHYLVLPTGTYWKLDAPSEGEAHIQVLGFIAKYYRDITRVEEADDLYAHERAYKVRVEGDSIWVTYAELDYEGGDTRHTTYTKQYVIIVLDEVPRIY